MMMTASSPLIIKPVGLTTGGRQFFGYTWKLRSKSAGLDLSGAGFSVAKSSRSETQPPLAPVNPFTFGANVYQSPPDKLEAVEEGLEKVIYRFRFLAILGVFGSLIGSFLCFVKGCTYVVSSVTELFVNRSKVVLLLVEAIDVYLLGTVMLVFGMGLYELFVSNLSTEESVLKENVHRSNLFGLFTLKERPRWLEIKTVSELKTKVGHVIVMLLLIGLLDKSPQLQYLFMHSDCSIFILLIICVGVHKDDNNFRVKLNIKTAAVLLQHFQLLAASRPLIVHSPAIPRAILMRKSPICPPSISSDGVTINRHKLGEDAFRPTSPGHSPGMGHKEPPGADDLPPPDHQ